MVWRASEALPEDWRTSRLGRYFQPMETTWERATQFDKWPEWSSELVKVERLDDVRGHPVWRETWRDGEVRTLEVVEHLPSRRLIRCVIDPDGPYGGCVTMQVTRRDDGSVLEITEALRMKSWAFRLGWTASGRTGRLDQILKDLGRSFGEESVRLGSSPREVNDPRPAPEAEPAEAPETTAAPAATEVAPSSPPTVPAADPTDLAPPAPPKTPATPGG